jgi:hypothetical protein
METKKVEFKLNLNLRRILIWFLILFLFVPYIVNFLLGSTGAVVEMPLSSAISDVKTGKVESVEIKGDESGRLEKKRGRVLWISCRRPGLMKAR